MRMTRRDFIAAATALVGTSACAASRASATAVPLQAPTVMATLHRGPDGALLGVSTAGELWQAAAGGWQSLGNRLDPAVPLASGHGRIVGRSAAGGLWVLEAGRVQTPRSPMLAPQAGLLVLALGIIAVAADAAGLHRVVRLDPTGSTWAESARSAVVVLPDARPLQFETPTAALPMRTVMSPSSARPAPSATATACWATRWNPRHCFGSSNIAWSRLRNWNCRRRMSSRTSHRGPSRGAGVAACSPCARAPRAGNWP